MSLNRKRLNIEISDEQYMSLNKYIPWGTRSMIFSIIIDQIIEVCEAGCGPQLLASIIAKRVKLDENGNIVPKE